MSFSKTLIGFIFLISLVFSCSSDDGTPQANQNAQIIGTYVLSEVNVSPPQDLNEDGIASTNLLDEMTCITGTINVNADTTWNINVIRLNVTTITGGLFFIGCGDADTSSGNWTFSNNQLTLNGGFEPTIYTLNGNTIVRQIDEDLPGFQSVVFTKQ